MMGVGCLTSVAQSWYAGETIILCGCLRVHLRGGEEQHECHQGVLSATQQGSPSEQLYIAHCKLYNVLYMHTGAMNVTKE